MIDQCAALQNEYDALLLKSDKSDQDVRAMWEIEAILARMFGPYDTETEL